MGSITDNYSSGSYGYRMSKAALNMVAKSLSVELKEREISVLALHPGWVQTDMTGHSGHITTIQSAKQIINTIDKLDIEISGTFLHSDGNRLPW